MKEHRMRTKPHEVLFPGYGESINLQDILSITTLSGFYFGTPKLQRRRPAVRRSLGEGDFLTEHPRAGRGCPCCGGGVG